MTLGHLEVRMRAAVLLDSAAEYKSFLLMYAKKIADEGYKSKGEELVRELYGPVY
jgi:protein HIRA/HIR1